MTPDDSIADMLYEHYGIDSSLLDAEALLKEKWQQECQEQEKLIAQLHQLQRDHSRLTGYLDELLHHLISIKRSRTWQLSCRLMRFAKRMLGRARGGDSFSQVLELEERYTHWKKSCD